MREGRLEKLNIEKSVVERLKEIKAKEESIKKEDPTYGTPWSIINPEKLIPEAQELFDLFDKDNTDTARAEILMIGERIEKIRDKEQKKINEEFIKWIDDKIEKKFLDKQLEEDKQKDNTR